MSAAWYGAAAGLGEGVTRVGAMWEAEDIRMQQAATRSAELKAQRLEEIRLAHENRMELANANNAARAASGGGGGADAQMDRAIIAGQTDNVYGTRSAPIPREKFTSQAEARVDTDPEYSDQVSRSGIVGKKMVDVFNEGAWTAAEKERTDGNVNLRGKLVDPAAYKAMQEGIQQESISRLMKVLDGVEDQKTREKLKAEIADLRAATDKGDRFKVADGTLVNEATGENSPTAVGKAQIAKDYADANKATAGKHDEALKALTQERLATSASLNEASRELSTLRGAVDKQSSKTMDAYTASVQAAEARVAELRQREDELYKRLNSYTVGAVAKKGGTGAAPITPVKDNGASMPAPVSKAERDKLAPGTRYKAPDGSIRIR